MAGVSIGQDQDVRGAVIHDVSERFVHEEFKGAFTKRASAANDGEPAGTTGAVNRLLGDRNNFEYHILGAGQTILGPIRTATGLNLKLDATDDEGSELTLGNEEPADTCISATAGATRGTFVVGTDGPFYFAWKMAIADVSGTDDCAMGFRKAELYQANLDDYDEAAVLNVISGNITIETILNNGTTTTTDTLDDWADAATKTLMVLVDSDGSISQDGTVGKCYFMVDGLNATTDATTRFKFDSGEVVIPFFFYLFAATSPGAITAKMWESGLFPMGQISQYELGAA